MIRLNHFGLIASVVFLVTPICSLASEDIDALAFECIQFSPQSTNFQELEAQAISISNDFCSLAGSRIPPSKESESQRFRKLEAFGAMVGNTLTVDFPASGIANRQVQSDYLNSRIQGYVNSSANSGLPSFNLADLSTIGSTRIDYFFGDIQDGSSISIDNGNNNYCRQMGSNNQDCVFMFNDLSRAINPYQRNLNSYNAYRTKTILQGLSENWDSYFETGRYQNSAGIVLTTFMEKDHLYGDRLVGPPKRQWLALQPGLIVENVNESPDGENIEYAIAMEWVGVNWWQDSFLGIPFGFSFASVYSDREGVKDVGHGMMFHFDNKYTVGFADHDGDTGIYLSLDILKLFQDKQKQWQKFRNRVPRI